MCPSISLIDLISTPDVGVESTSTPTTAAVMPPPAAAGGESKMSEPFWAKNVVVENPVQRKVTHEIDERLVGRYEVVYNPEISERHLPENTYFEIFPDGSLEIALHVLGSLSSWKQSENIVLTAFYNEYSIYISFRLIDGNVTFPGQSLSYDLVAKNDDLFNFVRPSLLDGWGRVYVKVS